MTRTLAIAALAAAALALEAAVLHVAVAAPLSSAVGALAEQGRPGCEETVVATPPRAPRAAKKA